MWIPQDCSAGIIVLKFPKYWQHRRDSEAGWSRQSNCRRHGRTFLETFSLSMHIRDWCWLGPQEKSAAATSVRLRVWHKLVKLAVRHSPSSRRRRLSLSTSSSLHAAPSSTHSTADKGEREDKRDVSIWFQPLCSSWSMNNSFLPKPDWGRANAQHVQARLGKAWLWPHYFNRFSNNNLESTTLFRLITISSVPLWCG